MDTYRTRYVRLALRSVDRSHPPRHPAEQMHRHQVRMCALRACSTADRPTARPTRTATDIAWRPTTADVRGHDLTLADEPEVIFDFQIWSCIIILLLTFEYSQLAFPTAAFESPARRQRGRLHEQRDPSGNCDNNGGDCSEHMCCCFMYSRWIFFSGHGAPPYSCTAVCSRTAPRRHSRRNRWLSACGASALASRSRIVALVAQVAGIVVGASFSVCYGTQILIIELDLT